MKRFSISLSCLVLGAVCSWGQTNATNYYYVAGAFYVQEPQGFVVVAPPLGVTVTALPPGATPVNINGMIYYQANGAYFLPVMQDGVTVYETVR